MEESTSSAIQRDSALIADPAALLHANGESTGMTESAAMRLARRLHCEVHITIFWNGVTIVPIAAGTITEQRLVHPVAVHMRKVESCRDAVESFLAGSQSREQFRALIDTSAKQPTSSNLAFVIAAAVGAVALAFIFGASHPGSLTLIVLSAALGGIVRRLMAAHDLGVPEQAFTAAFIAGIIGAIAVDGDLTGPERLVAVCPCMILVPGPHILNGALDIINTRLPLGWHRLMFAGYILIAIASGLLVGLLMGGTSLPATAPGASVGWWIDVPAAAIVTMAYSTYYSAPARLYLWPAVIGGAGHAVRWLLLNELDANAVVATFVACFFVGAVLAPVAHRRKMPFASIGFAAVVALIPGIYVFRMVSGVLTLATNPPADMSVLVNQIVQDSAVAVFLTLAIIAGLFLPVRVLEYLRRGPVG